MTSSLGVLALPYVLKMCGLILGVLMLFLGYFATYWSLQLIAEADCRTGGNATLKELYIKCGGSPLAKFYDSTIVFTQFCAQVGQSLVSKFPLSQQ